MDRKTMLQIDASCQKFLATPLAGTCICMYGYHVLKPLLISFSVLQLPF